ncbi:kinetochore Sim4 complex subunit FTA2-domain-containing protein [Xylariaceae sp. FL1272]|nr:kinetochore Sim4 complex subunit FTA2-domain-containing protein [Xylariaceae sp. FL1272]
MASLPDLPGPKISPFSTNNALLRITFLQRLGVGGDATVWKIEIERQVYALKIFGFGSFLFYKSKIPKILQENGVTSELIHPYRDPFTSECRAFGRLQEANNENLAIKCFGYIILTEAQEQLLIEAGGGDDRPIQRDDERLKNEPLRCIVKKYIESPEYIQHNQFPKMIRDLDAVHRLGIVITDIRADLNGVMMDFSRSLTVPHPQLIPAWQEFLYSKDWKSQATARGDEEDFDAMIDRYNRMVDTGVIKGPRVWTRLCPNDRFKERLRKRSDESAEAVRFPRVRPELYNWHRLSKKDPDKRAIRTLRKTQTAMGLLTRRKRAAPRPVRRSLNPDAESERARTTKEKRKTTANRKKY